MSTIIQAKQTKVAVHATNHVPTLVTAVQAVVAAMTNNPHFPSPNPTLAAVASQASDLTTYQGQVDARVKGAAAIRDEKRSTLLVSYRRLGTYVQTVADADPANATTIIHSAGFAVAKPRVVPPKVFTAKHGPLTGSANLVVPALKGRVAYEWEQSTDGGKTWTLATATTQAKASVTGLAAGTAAQFRYRVVAKAGPGNWSDPVTLVVQ